MFTRQENFLKLLLEKITVIKLYLILEEHSKNPLKRSKRTKCTEEVFQIIKFSIAVYLMFDI